MQYISCYKCNHHGMTSEPCTCDEVREPQKDDHSALVGVLACPFCDSAAKMVDDPCSLPGYFVQCVAPSCGARKMTYSKTVDGAAEQWNKRAG